MLKKLLSIYEDFGKNSFYVTKIILFFISSIFLMIGGVLYL